jgi:2-iminoacetate synthase
MITPEEIKATLNDNNPQRTESLAQESKQLTEQYFGRTISLYAPLYLSNFCSSECTYCGFRSKYRIERFKLTPEQTHAEMKFLAGEGIENVLLLTGESYKVTPTSYLKEAVEIAKQYFPSIALEVHPMDETDYRELFESGVDGVTVYQETYDRRRYKEVHLSGLKADYDYRYGTPERAAAAGMRQISTGILLGLSDDLSADLFELYKHLRYMERTFPGVEYSVSFPRLRTIKDQEFARCDIDDLTFVKIICLTRTLFPRVGINLSTRERPELRDKILELGVTRMSAGSNTSVGGYTLKAPESQDPQFDIEDTRTVADVVRMLKTRGFDPVFTDWRRIENKV